MPTRAEILDTLASSQTQVLAFFHGLSAQDLERPATASELPGAPPWCAKDHLAHLVKNERNIQHLLRRILADEPRDVFLRLQYPEGMPLPGILGDWDALAPQEQVRLELAVASTSRCFASSSRRWVTLVQEDWCFILSPSASADLCAGSRSSTSACLNCLWSSHPLSRASTER